MGFSIETQREDLFFFFQVSASINHIHERSAFSIRNLKWEESGEFVVTVGKLLKFVILFFFFQKGERAFPLVQMEPSTGSRLTVGRVQESFVRSLFYFLFLFFSFFFAFPCTRISWNKGGSDVSREIVMPLLRNIRFDCDVIDRRMFEKFE